MKKGFTLAEVLITLAIIGVVAALTIPSVILNTNQTEYRTALKKAVSVLNQAASLNLAINNESPSETTSGSAFLNVIQSQMNTIKAASGACSGASLPGNGSAISDISAASTCSFTTTDGMQFLLLTGTGLGTAEVGGTAAPASGGASACHETSTATAPCYVLVDVNGDKNPNKMTTESGAPTDRFVLKFGGENGTTITPIGAGAEVMFKK